MDEILYHYGIKGQKWGIRRHRNNHETSANSRNTVQKKDSRVNREKIERTVKIASAIAATAAISYAGLKFSTSPKVRSMVARALDKLSDKSVSEISSMSDVQIFSKSLGRMLTVEEMVDAGFI